MSVLVVGSLNVDLISKCETAPKAGETIHGDSFTTSLGGKGANQAFACKRMGSETFFAGALGNDNYKDLFLDNLKKENISIEYIKFKNTNTGVASILVEANGQNRICLCAGANLAYSQDDLNEIDQLMENVNIVVTQCEMQKTIVEELALKCQKANKPLILNPAPATKLNDYVYQDLYCITPNETELATLINKDLNTLDDYILGAKELLAKGVQNVIVTLGEKGSLLVNQKNEILIPARKVNVVDTIGAGDSFTGAIAAMLDQGHDLLESMKIATYVASLAIQKEGGIPSMPYKDEVLKEMAKDKM